MSDPDAPPLPEAVSLRPVNEESDRAFLLSLFEESSRRLFGSANLPAEHLKAILGQQFDARNRRFRDAFPDGNFQLVLQGGDPVGNWFTGEREGCLEIIDAALVGPCRGKGIVAALTRRLAASAMRENRRLLAFVEKQNPAQAIWFHLGFEIIEDRETHYRIEYFPKEPDTGSLPGGFALRHARSGDRAFLAALFGHARARTFEAIDLPEEQRAALVSQQFAIFESQARQQYPDGIRYLLVHGGRPVGEWYLDEDDIRIYIVNAALLPEYQGQGISAALHRDLFARADREGKPVRSHVEKGNPAVDILVHLGLRIVGDAGAFHELEYRGAASN